MANITSMPKIGKTVYVFNLLDTIDKRKVIATGKENNEDVFITRNNQSDLEVIQVKEAMYTCFDSLKEIKEANKPLKGYAWLITDRDENDRPCTWVLDEK